MVVCIFPTCSPCWGLFATFFSLWGAFFTMWGPFATFSLGMCSFVLMGGLFWACHAADLAGAHDFCGCP